MRKIICDLCNVTIKHPSVNFRINHPSRESDPNNANSSAMLQVRLGALNWNWRHEPNQDMLGLAVSYELPDLCNKCLIQFVFKPIIAQLEADSK